MTFDTQPFGQCGTANLGEHTCSNHEPLRAHVRGRTEIGINKKSRSDRRQQRSSPSPSESAGLQSGELQGLSNVESVDSESVDEVLEEGNAFEAGVVSGVEELQTTRWQGSQHPWPDPVISKLLAQPPSLSYMYLDGLPPG